MTYRLLLKVCFTGALSTCVCGPAMAQEVLDDHIEIRRARQGQDAQHFTIYGTRDTHELVFAIVNRSATESVVLAPAFLSDLTARATRDGMPFPIAVEWLRATVYRERIGDLEAVAGAEILLLPKEWVRLSAEVRPGAGGGFGPGTYRYTFDKTRANGHLREADGSLWRGRSARDVSVTVLVAEPRTPDEVRNWRLIEGGHALVDRRFAEALGHFQTILEENPGDAQAHAAAGEAYLRLGRFREAIGEFQQALTDEAFTNGSLLPAYLAYAFVGAGDIAGADAVLARKGLSPEARRAEIEKYRAALASEFAR